MTKQFSAFLLSLALFTSVFINANEAKAYGVLTDSRGSILTLYNPPNVPYMTDAGGLGEINNPQSVTVSTLNKWNVIEDSKINFINQGMLSTDINEDNFRSFLNSDNNGITVIAFDADGSLTDALNGAGSRNGILGFAGPDRFNSDGTIRESEAVFNGFLFTRDGAGLNSQAAVDLLFTSTVLHEFGHAVGLDHSQIFVEDFNDNVNLTRIPVMFPFAANPNDDLLIDDIVSASAPAPYREASFGVGTGTVSGSVTGAGGVPVRSANIVFYKADDLQTALSNVSDSDLAGRGNYKAEGLPPGEYFAKIEPIDPSFTGGSSVGPRQRNSNVPNGFFNGANRPFVSGRPGSVDAQTITVVAGETTNLDFNTASTDPSFRFTGSKFRNGVRLRSNRSRTFKIRVRNNTRSRVRVRLSNDQPDLVSLNREELSIRRRGSKRVKVTVASEAEFIELLGEDAFNNDDLSINIIGEDTESGFATEREIPVF